MSHAQALRRPVRSTSRARPPPRVAVPREGLRYDPVLLAAVLLLVTTGVVMVYSASAVFAEQQMHDPLWFFKRQVAGVAAGLLALLAALQLGARRLEALAVPLLLLSLLLLALVLVPGLGHTAGGARRWLKAGPITFQPSELAKVAWVLWLSRSLARKGERVRLFSVGFAPHLAMLGVLGGLLLLEPDFGTTVVLAALTFCLLFVAGARVLWLAGVVAGAVGVAALLVVTSSYRMERVRVLLNPWLDPRKSGYQTIESLLGLGSGGAFGVGLGESTQKLWFLPAAHTDFILSILGEELGFAGVAALLVLFALVLVRGVRAAHAAPDAFGCYAALGLTLLLAFEALVNAGMTMGVLPTKGMALPFVSYGMTSLVTSLFAAGILLSISGGPGGFLGRAQGGRR